MTINNILFALVICLIEESLTFITVTRYRVRKTVIYNNITVLPFYYIPYNNIIINQISKIKFKLLLSTVENKIINLVVLNYW